ncbi:2-C-methyl-D-erythritol 2,4-cyclodiphosphate synthase [Candidatus Cyrtobacter comes]|uniref:2-C-methyl-D-erythritol 2,4-cyclodiphosphate synthase n=1 Tax=Candidatus Cyrtobacter comes TaxID=675776 RepID=A0ABU5L7U0_9RICK|nr:2-C-methyl-D-erythritol 2,4-cyclodiphosphate synthase [Candidatus Cyrtobacter comes]MDZ5762112.1 2-C-methyl-D-erythritol 2,4-cyclodiphosphate synthase [Candidatus Cyrtobacter comes]
MSVQRVGFGFDLHKIECSETEQEVFLCGVPFKSKYKVIAHSDGDIGLHAIIEALLGALALGNIGVLFPNTDPKYKGISSSLLLKEVFHKIKEIGAQIVNIDVTLICERPKIMSRSYELRQNVANILELDVSKVSVKATTSEGVGIIGRQEAILAQAICMVLI